MGSQGPFSWVKPGLISKPCPGHEGEENKAVTLESGLCVCWLTLGAWRCWGFLLVGFCSQGPSLEQVAKGIYSVALGLAKTWMCWPGGQSVVGRAWVGPQQ